MTITCFARGLVVDKPYQATASFNLYYTIQLIRFTCQCNEPLPISTCCGGTCVSKRGGLPAKGLEHFASAVL
jgi:hypothetical protein